MSAAEETAVYSARDAAFQTALRVAGGSRDLAVGIRDGAELTVIRRLCCARLPGGEAEFWRLVEQELKR